MNDIKETVKAILTDYLKHNELRKTPERFAILEAIYDTDVHFDVDWLYNEMKRKKFTLSRA
ncbi:MAG TPA: transcriptional repressor, partial [Bacteroidia bacterium]|nr:transcriptional repressor [Bacteroidia bacterium]